jgi:hypothetical protein
MRAEVVTSSGTRKIQVPDDIAGIEAAVNRELVPEAIADRRRGAPTLYASGVRYEREDGEQWRSPLAILGSTRRADCEDLASWRVADLRVAGESGARVEVVRTGPSTLHAVVRRANGEIEDPSRKLGMGQGERMAVEGIAWRTRRARGGYEAEVDLPLGPLEVAGRGRGGTIRVRRKGPSKRTALTRSLNVAAKVLDSPLLQSIMPPQAVVALKAAKALGKLFKIKKLKLWGAAEEQRVIRRLRPGLRRLAGVMLED